MSPTSRNPSRPGESFEDREVARLYVHRPDYPKAVYDRLIELAPGRGRLLDLGCGTGKIARHLAGTFEQVTGLDASGEMLEVARTLPGGQADNISWVRGLAETAPLDGNPLDLIVAAASIHWVDHAVVFPRLRAAARENHTFVVVDGDGAHEPSWQAAWDEFLARWIYDLKGERYEPHRPDSPHAAKMNRYRDWIDQAGETAILSPPVSQAVPDFVACQHSRDTFAPYKLGPKMTAFDRELTEFLTPHAVDGRLSYSVKTTLTWGRIRA